MIPHPPKSDMDEPMERPIEIHSMRLRDWFAGMVLQGLIAANPDNVPKASLDQTGTALAVVSYGIADAMLKARK